MRDGGLQHHEAEFSERNLLLALVLGMRARGDALEAFLARHLPTTATLPSVTLTDHDAALADFVLGLVSFSRTLRRITDDAVRHRAAPLRPVQRPLDRGSLR